MTRSGLILDNRYRLDERIAAGGVGQVWRASDLLLERTVAVKVLRPEYADHPETLERFRKEARNAGALNNPHVAQVYDYGHAGPDGSPYLVLEFVDGPSLADLLVVDPIEPAQALDVIAQAADGLAAAHRAGVIHRDIKPGNILISSEGKVKVTDFGIAHAAGQAPVTGPGLVMGTTQYMAPERIAGNQGTAASDLYALGIVLHECLTGMPPHDGTPAEVMAAHLYLPLPPLPAGVPAELDSLVERLTVKDPAARISDALELAELAVRLRDAVTAGVLVAPAGAPASPPGYGPDSGEAAPGLPQPEGMTSALGVPAADNWTDPPRPAGGTWSVPQRSSPSGASTLSHPGEPGEQHRRRRAGVLTAGAAVMASVGLAAVLVSGAFRGTPAANQAPPGTATTGGPAIARLPPRGASGTPTPTGGTAAPGTTTPGTTVTSPRPTTAAPRPATSAANPGKSSPASSATGSAPSTPGTGVSPSGAASASPSGTTSPSPGGAQSSSPPAACLLGICL